MRGFSSGQFYLHSILNQFDIFSVSEHWLFEEQLCKLECVDSRYVGYSKASQNNPNILSGQRGQGGVEMLWKAGLGDFVSKLSIDSDRIIGAKFVLENRESLFVLAVYLPASNHSLEEFHEALDFLWALYEHYSDQGITVIIEDFNGALGYLGGNRICSEPNQRGKHIDEFFNFFNLSAVNLDKSCAGPLETFYADSGTSSSAMDLIVVPRVLTQYINWTRVFDREAEKLSDHIPIAISFKKSLLQHNNKSGSSLGYSRKHVSWHRFNAHQIHNLYTLSLKESPKHFDCELEPDKCFENLS